jgi:hypothetical protein
MNEQRKKRTRKANSASVRSLQARQDEHDLQAEIKSMPQQEGEVVAETDRTNKETGGEMYRDSFIDKMREHKTTIIQAAVVVAITVIVSAIMILQLAPSKAAYNAAIAGFDGEITRLEASINTWGTKLTNQIENLETDTETATATNSRDIETLQTWAEGAEGRITTVEAQNSPPEGYLTGTAGNYTLHAKSSESGNFTANVHLVYSRAFGYNGTYEDAQQYFYSGINWTQTTPSYATVVTFNGTAWELSELWFNIGTFAMTANNETAVDIKFSGLNSTYNPDFAYAEIFPVLSNE